MKFLKIFVNELNVYRAYFQHKGYFPVLMYNKVLTGNNECLFYNYEHVWRD